MSSMEMDLSERELRVFVDAVERFFKQVTGVAASVRGAYLGDAETALPLQTMAGLIEIGGHFRGQVCISAPRSLIRHVLVEMGERDQSDFIMLDTIGEIANTIAGNAREYFGETMEISVPSTWVGVPPSMENCNRMRPYVLSIDWRSYPATLVVDMRRVSHEERLAS